MAILGWQRRLDDASTTQQVVDVASEFLALWTREELDQLPPDCRPEQVDDAEQVNSYALRLAHRDTISPGGISALHRMATFFTKAALRIFQIKDTVLAEHVDRRGKGGGGHAPQ